MKLVNGNKMRFCWCLLILLLIIGKGSSLICYDNTSGEQPTLIGCNFPGAACGFTSRTYVGGSNGTSITYEVSFCAHAETTCLTGPGNVCAEVVDERLFTRLNLKEVHDCKTVCCDSDKCNVGGTKNNDSIVIGGITERNKPKDFDGDPLKCFQTVGRREEKVECLFVGAVCVYHEKQVTYDDWKGESLNKGFQLCGRRSDCEQLKKDLCGGQNASEGEMCTYSCCDTHYCNALPDSSHYVKGRDEKRPTKALPNLHTSNFASDSESWEKYLSKPEARKRSGRVNRHRGRTPSRRKQRERRKNRRRNKSSSKPTRLPPTEATTVVTKKIGDVADGKDGEGERDDGGIVFTLPKDEPPLPEPTTALNISRTRRRKIQSEPRPLLDSGALTAIAIMVSLTFATVVIGFWVNCRSRTSKSRQSEQGAEKKKDTERSDAVVA